jgi:hypothetical protein
MPLHEFLVLRGLGFYAIGRAGTDSPLGLAEREPVGLVRSGGCTQTVEISSLLVEGLRCACPKYNLMSASTKMISF